MNRQTDGHAEKQASGDLENILVQNNCKAWFTLAMETEAETETEARNSLLTVKRRLKI